MIETIAIYSTLAESCAFIFGIAALLSRDDIRLKSLFCVSAACMSVHFFIEGAATAGFMAAIGSIRFILSIYPVMHRSGAVFICLYMIFGSLSITRPIDILPMISSVTATYGLFYRKSLAMRGCFLIAGGLWLVHNAVIGSYIAAGLEALFAVTNIYMILKLKRETRDRQSTD